MDLDQCEFGGASKKSTRLLVSNALFLQLACAWVERLGELRQNSLEDLLHHSGPCHRKADRIDLRRLCRKDQAAVRAADLALERNVQMIT